MGVGRGDYVAAKILPVRYSFHIHFELYTDDNSSASIWFVF